MNNFFYMVCCFMLIFSINAQAQQLPYPVKLECNSEEKIGYWKQIGNISDIIIPAGDDDASRKDVERLACYQMNLIDIQKREILNGEYDVISEFAKEGDDFLDSIYDSQVGSKSYIYFEKFYYDDLLASVLIHLLGSDVWDLKSVNSSRVRLGMIYSNASSSMYNPDLATHLFRRVAISLTRPHNNPKRCKATINKIAEEGTSSGLRKKAYLSALEICERDDVKLFKLAEKYENGVAPYIKDQALALFLYDRSYLFGSLKAKEKYKGLKAIKLKSRE